MRGQGAGGMAGCRCSGRCAHRQLLGGISGVGAAAVMPWWAATAPRAAADVDLDSADRPKDTQVAPWGPVPRRERPRGAPGRGSGGRGKGPDSIAEFLDEADKNEVVYDRVNSFHRLYIRNDGKQVLLAAKWSEMGELFYPQVTSMGEEGGVRDMEMRMLRPTGLQFIAAPDRKSVHLVQAQERLSSDDFAASTYDPSTGGMQGGYTRSFTPIVTDFGEQAYLLDVTSWVFSFATLFGGPPAMSGPGGTGETSIREYKGFPTNMMFYMQMRRAPAMTLQTAASAVQFFSVAFCLLPTTPMVPRPWDRRVGFFTTEIQIGSPKRITVVEQAINRWRLTDNEGKLKPIVFHLDPSTPEIYIPTLKKGVTSWNSAFAAAGFPDAVICLAKGDTGYPEDFSTGDARFSSIHMTNPERGGLLGYGPSVVDFRSGEILAAQIMLGFDAFSSVPSRFSDDLLTVSHRRACGARTPLLDADHPDVLLTLHNVVAHEVGHALGLRHNFIGSEDGNTSLMDYQDDFDVTDPQAPKFGSDYLLEPGRYDKYAIVYGYTALDGETRGWRHDKLAFLAAGQDKNDTNLLHIPRNPLFATDESLYDDFDPRVNTFVSVDGAKRMGREKMDYVAVQRKKLLQLVRNGALEPDVYTMRMLLLLRLTWSDLQAATKWVGGGTVNAARDQATPASIADMTELLGISLDFMIGDVFRVSEEEQRFLLYDTNRRFGGGSYALTPINVLRQHSSIVDNLLHLLLRPTRLGRLEMHYSQREASRAGSGGFNTFDVLISLAFGRSDSGNDGLLVPLVRLVDASEVSDASDEMGDVPTPVQHKDAATELSAEHLGLLEAFGRDHLRCEARLLFARIVNDLSHDDTALAAVQTGARAFVYEVKSVAEALGLPRPVGANGIQLSPVAAAHWELFLEKLTKKKESDASGLGGILGLMMGRDGESSQLKEDREWVLSEPFRQLSGCSPLLPVSARL